MRYWPVDILFWQLSFDHDVNVQYQQNISRWFPGGVDGRDGRVDVGSRDYQNFLHGYIDNQIYLAMGFRCSAMISNPSAFCSKWEVSVNVDLGEG